METKKLTIVVVAVVIVGAFAGTQFGNLISEYQLRDIKTIKAQTAEAIAVEKETTKLTVEYLQRRAATANSSAELQLLNHRMDALLEHRRGVR